MSAGSARQMIKRVKQMIPPLKEGFHKGQAGRIAVIGGSENYTGAPYYSCESCMRFGADMGHIICEEGAAKVIKTYSPDLIVYPLMKQRIHAKKEETADSIAREIYPLFERMHAIVIGPGLGREDLMQETAAKLIQEARRRDIPIVVDADGLWLIKNQPELVMGYENVVLTPNVMEFARLCDTMKVDQKGDPKTLCATLSKAMKGITIVQKGREDYISNGKETDIVNIRGGLKRCGGQGDVLSGCLATMLGWKKVYQERIWDHDNSLSGPELTLLAAYGACTVTRYCSRIAFDEKGRGMMATDLVANVGKAYHDIFELEDPNL